MLTVASNIDPLLQRERAYSAIGSRPRQTPWLQRNTRRWVCRASTNGTVSSGDSRFIGHQTGDFGRGFNAPKSDEVKSEKKPVGRYFKKTYRIRYLRRSKYHMWVLFKKGLEIVICGQTIAKSEERREMEIIRGQTNKVIDEIGSLEVVLEVRANDVRKAFNAYRDEKNRERKRKGEKSLYSPLNLRVRVRRGKLEIEWLEMHMRKVSGGKRRACSTYIKKRADDSGYLLHDLYAVGQEHEVAIIRATEQSARELRDAWDKVVIARREMNKILRAEKSGIGDVAQWLETDTEEG